MEPDGLRDLIAPYVNSLIGVQRSGFPVLSRVIAVRDDYFTSQTTETGARVHIPYAAIWQVMQEQQANTLFARPDVGSEEKPELESVPLVVVVAHSTSIVASDERKSRWIGGIAVPFGD